MKMHQYTIRGVPPRVDQALREKARRAQKSLNQTALEALLAGLGTAVAPALNHNLDEFRGTWVEDPAFDAAQRDFGKIDREMWQ